MLRRRPWPLRELNESDPPALPGFEDLPVPDERTWGRRHRPVDVSLAPTDQTIELFWSKVVKSPACWYFVGAISGGDGYGRINYQRDGRQRTVLAHRFALELAFGRLDEGVVGEHKCNEPLCVRVDDRHLVCSTQTENVRYAVALGRLSGNDTLHGAWRSRYERSIAIRAALADGYDPVRLGAAKHAHPQGQGTLF